MPVSVMDLALQAALNIVAQLRVNLWCLSQHSHGIPEPPCARANPLGSLESKIQEMRGLAMCVKRGLIRIDLVQEE